MKRDSSLNVYRQRKISFEDRVVVEGSKTSSINQYGAGPRHPKTGQFPKWEELEPKVNYSLLMTPDQVYMSIFSQFGEIVWQRLFNIVRILQTTALNDWNPISQEVVFSEASLFCVNIYNIYDWI